MSNTCEICGEPATYGASVSQIKRCATHKLPKQLNMDIRLCCYVNIHRCGKLAAFNTPGTTRGLYCGSHKLPYMINVKVPICRDNTA